MDSRILSQIEKTQLLSNTSNFKAKTALDSVAKSLVLSKMKQIRLGSIRIVDESLANTSEGAKVYQFDSGRKTQFGEIEIRVIHSQFYSRILLGGSVAAGESYTDGDWECENLTGLIRFFVLNREALLGIDGGLGSLMKPLRVWMHQQVRRNSLKGARENIKDHYDLGNDFFKLFLDPTMTYSSGIFKSNQISLEEASLEKIDRLCQKMNLNSNDHLLEIGTGWGAFALHAAKKYGCRVTTTTISTEQYLYAKELFKREGVDQKIELLNVDYRTLKDSYNKLVSVEMIEAVGLSQLNTYFKKCSELITEDGLMGLQVITIRDHFYEEAKNSVDFIQKCIFPGTGIPSISAMMDSVRDFTDLILVEQSDFGYDYAKTLNYWSKNLRKNQGQLEKLGYPKNLYRLWQYYFSYCEGGFLERNIGVSQMVLEKPKYRK